MYNYFLSYTKFQLMSLKTYEFLYNYLGKEI